MPRPKLPAARKLLHDTLEPRIMLDAVPTVGGGPPEQVQLGEDFSFAVDFSNTSPTDTGYGPFIDLIFPVTGQDGVDVGNTSEPDDGIDFRAASYLGQPVTAIEVEFDSGGEAEHPLAVDGNGDPLVLSGTPGDKLVVLQLPFGSFTPGQPEASIQVDASLSGDADTGPAGTLDLQTRGGFQFGNDPLDNPTGAPGDPSLVSAFSSNPVSASLFTVAKRYVGPENETATGPSFERSNVISVAIADGQTLTDFSLTDDLPDNIVVTGVTSNAPGGVTINGPVLNAAPTANRVLDVAFNGPVSGDFNVTYSFYVSDVDAAGASVLDPVSGDDRVVSDPGSGTDVTATGTWNPTDPRDAAGPVQATLVATAGLDGGEFLAKSIATQKSVSNLTDTVNTPGDSLEYRINFQISDYYTFEELVFTDVFSDGQSFDAAFTPTFEVTDRGVATGVLPFDAADFTVAGDPDPNDGTRGDTQITFRLSDALQRSGSDGVLQGGLADGPGLAATGTLVFRTQIDDSFSDDFPSSDPSVDQGDRLSNRVEVAGQILDNDTSALLGVEADGSSAGVTIAGATFSKSIYAVGGSTSVSPPVLIGPGDTVTYRLTYNVPSTDFESLTISDFLPLPIFDALDVTTFNAIKSATPPPVGVVQYGPADTFLSFASQDDATGDAVANAPALTRDGTGNALTLDFGNVDDPSNTARTIDLLFTVEASTDPFADGLKLTNFAQVREGTTNADASISAQIVQLTLGEPDVNVTKAVVATDDARGVFDAATGPAGVTFNAPGSSTPFSGTISSTGLATAPVDSNLEGIDAGSVVTFAIVLENIGSGPKGAFDVELFDVLPDGFALTSGGGNLQVRDGAGNPVATSGDLFDPNDPLKLADNLNGAGAADDRGALDAFDASSGGNIAVVTYDAVALAAGGAADSGTPAGRGVEAGTVLTSDVTLSNFSNVDNGQAFLSPGNFRGDAASVTPAEPTIISRSVSTEATATNNDGPTDVAVGELATFTTTIRVPEGTTRNLTLDDRLQNGLVFVELVSVTASAGVSVENNPSDPGTDNANNPSIKNGGKRSVIDLGEVRNVNTDDGTDDTVTVTYRAVLTDIPVNAQPSTGDRNIGQQAPQTFFLADTNRDGNLRNDGSTTLERVGPATGNPKVRVIEPLVGLTSGVVVGTAGGRGDAGDAVTYTATLNNAAGRPDAFDVALSQPLPSGKIDNLVVDSVSDSANILTAASFQIQNGTLAFDPAGPGVDADATLDLAAGRTVTVTVTGTLNSSVSPDETIDSEVTVSYSSLDGDVEDRSGFISATVDGAGSDEVDGERDSVLARSSTITIVSPDLSKTVVATSEGSTQQPDATTADAAVGELLRHRLVAELPESTIDNLVVVDTLPVGFTAAGVGDVRVSFVTDASLTRQSGGDGVDLAQANNNQTTPTYQLPASRVSESGGKLVFEIGDVVVGQDGGDGNAELLIIEYNLQATNTVAVGSDFGSANNAATRSTTAEVQVDRDVAGTPTPTPVSTSNAVEVTVVEPRINDVAKAFAGSGNPVTADGAGDAGDTATYRVTFSNTGDAAAFETRVRDAFPDGVTLTGYTLTGASVATNGDNNQATPGANVLDLTLEPLGPGATVTLDYTVRLDADVQAGQDLGSSVVVTYSGLPGDGTAVSTAGSPTSNTTGTATPGAAGDSDGERSGFVPTTANDYRDSRGLALQVDTPTLDLQPLSDTALSIGETLTYDTLVTLPEGVTPDLVFTQSLPPGLRFESLSVLTTPAESALLGTGFSGVGLAGGTPNSPQNPGDDVEISFGDVTTNGSNGDGTSANQFVVRVIASVANTKDTNASTDTGNERGDLRPSQSSLSYTEPGGATATVADAAVVGTIIEPTLTLSSAIVGTSRPDGGGGFSTSGLVAGDTVQYQITVDHTAASNSTAFDLVLTDAAATGLRITSIDAVGGTNSGNLSPGSFEITGGGTGLRLDPTVSRDLATGDDFSVVYTAEVRNDAAQDGTLTNAVRLDWSSLDDAPGTTITPGERNGDGGVNQGGFINDYRQVDDRSVATGQGITLEKRLAGAQTDFAVGEEILIELELDLINGTTESVVLQDTLPDGLTLVPGSVQLSTGHTGVTSGYVDEVNSVALNPVTGELVIDLGDVVVDPAVAGPDSLTVSYRVLVGDDPAVTYSGTLNPDATVSSTSTASGLTDTDNVAFTVSEPELVAELTVDEDEPKLGDVVTFTLTVDHGGGTAADAFDVGVSVPLSDGFRLVPGSVTVVDAGGNDVTAATVSTGNGPSDAAVRLDLDRLDTTEQLTATYQAEVTSQLSDFGAVRTSTATVTYDGLAADDPPGAGNDGPDRDYVATALQNILVRGADLRTTIDDGGQTRNPGDSFRYTVNVINQPLTAAAPANDIEVRVALPQGVTLTGVSGGYPFTQSRGVVTITGLPDLMIGEQVDVELDVRVDPAVPAGVRALGATATAEHAGIEPTPQDNSDTDLDFLEAAPAYELTLLDDRVVGPSGVGAVGAGETVTFTVTLTNTGNQPGTDVVLSQNLPTDALRFRAADNGGAYDASTGNVTWRLPQVEVGQTLTFQVEAEVLGAISGDIDQILNTVSVAEDADGSADPDVATATLTSQLALEAVPDLEVSITDGRELVSPGDPIEVEVTVTNRGPGQAATGVRVVNDLPPGVFDPQTLVISDGGVYDPINQRIIWRLDEVPVGAEVSLGYTVTLSRSGGGDDSYVNRVSISDDGRNGVERVLSNNSGVDTNGLEVFVFDLGVDARSAGTAGSTPGDAATDSVPPPFGGAGGVGSDLDRFRLPMTPIDPVYAGVAAPGSTVTVQVFDAAGNYLGTRSVVADAGGHWAAALPVTTLGDRYLADGPAAVLESRLFDYGHRQFELNQRLLGSGGADASSRVGATLPAGGHEAVVSASGGLAAGLTPTELFFSPASNGGAFFRAPLQADHVLDEAAGTVTRRLQQSLRDPFGLAAPFEPQTLRGASSGPSGR